MSQTFRNIVFLSDRCGTGKWRRIWPIQTLDCISQQLNTQIDYSQTPIIDQNFYRGMTSITIQRWITDQQRTLLEKFLKPVMDANCGWIIYEIDDNMSDHEIPKYNRGRKAFEGSHIQENIKALLNASDFVTVTTDYLKTFYHEHYSVPLDNIIAIPNLLPKYLFGDRYDPEKKIEQFRKNRTKPRIGIVSSLSHFNVDKAREDKNGLVCRETTNERGINVWINENNEEVKYDDTYQITDDFDEISNIVRETINDFQWVCFGYCPPQIEDLARDGKIECHQGVQIMNYASKLENLQLQAIVSPIKKMVFNYSKSFIKTMEAAALGIPLYATNCLPYNRVMNSSQLFDTGTELKEKLLKLKNGSVKIYEDIISRQWKWLNSPCSEGDFNINNFWLEDNINIWIDLFRLRQKTLSISLNSFIQSREKQKSEESNNVLYKNDNGVVITK